MKISQYEQRFDLTALFSFYGILQHDIVYVNRVFKNEKNSNNSYDLISTTKFQQRA